MLKPRIKPFIEFYWENGEVHFLRIPGEAITLEDTNKFVYSSAILMDGIKTIEQLKNCLQKEYPDEHLYVHQLIEALDEQLLLEDAELIQSDITSKNLRFDKNIEFLGSFAKVSISKYSLQKKITDLKVAVLGLGGVGSNVLVGLSALGVANFSLVDFDRVELSNLNRQVIYDPSQVGKLKTEAAKEKLKSFLPDANIKIISSHITSENDVYKIIDGHDYVISAVDTPLAHILDWVNSACVKKMIPFLCGGVDSRCSGQPKPDTSIKHISQIGSESYH